MIFQSYVSISQEILDMYYYFNVNSLGDIVLYSENMIIFLI